MPLTGSDGTDPEAEPRGLDTGTEFDRLFTLLYPELRKIAHRQLRRERHGHTLQTTALVHEAYLKLYDRPDTSWAKPAQFRAFVARAMRQILIDYARGRAAQKRGGDAVQITLQPGMAVTEPEQSVDLIVLDKALNELGMHDARLVRVVECRFFGGLTMPEIAEALAILEAAHRVGTPLTNTQLAAFGDLLVRADRAAQSRLEALETAAAAHE